MAHLLAVLWLIPYRSAITRPVCLLLRALLILVVLLSVRFQIKTTGNKARSTRATAIVVVIIGSRVGSKGFLNPVTNPVVAVTVSS